MTILLETQISLFIGRIHPLLVHLPIGFIILSVLFELIAWKKKVDMDLAIAYGMLTGAVFGVFASILGFLLASDGGYNDDVLSVHKWTGITTTILAFSAYFLKRKQHEAQLAKKAYPALMALTLIFLSVAGHYGGTLTHGSTYLFEHAPGPLRSLAGLKPIRNRITALDSALVYEDVIHHIFETKCNVCHNKDKAKGDLLLISQEDIKRGGENGEIIVAGDPSASELFRRITLDPNHEEFMPTEGRTPLTKEETALIEWWIQQGAPFDQKLTDLTLSERIKGYLKEIGIGAEKSFLASLNLPPVNPEIYNSIVATGFSVKTIANNTTLLEASFSPYNLEGVNQEKLNALSKAKENITWLNLSGTNVQDEGLAYIGQLTNLTKLKLNQTQITNEGIKHLQSLKNLEYLNLYGTKITDQSVESILQLTGLKKLYIWQTEITQQGLEKIKESAPHLQVEVGMQQFAY
ncbi:MAG: DUF2231 domain-containing protein [Cyclobacteriaceae bacterium]